MKISAINIQNFRQYYGNIHFDLSPEENKNIVLIGGRNGYGKTTFLISIVWCLYGEKISQVDENFKKEIQKEKNYSQFMRESLNSTAKSESQNSFSVKLKITELDLPQMNISSLIIKREFNYITMTESLSIIDFNTNQELFIDNEDKINFINDFIIPLDAAKFVFFDAEKIAALAELSTKEEGNILNDALGKILGLDIFEDLIEDLGVYCNNLKKEVANQNIQDQINDREENIRINKKEIEKYDEDIAEKTKINIKTKSKIQEYENYINQNGNNGIDESNREIFLNQRTELEETKNKNEDNFNELSELIPLAILAGKLEEINEQLLLQELNETTGNFSSEINDKIGIFIERLFNQAPEPEESSFTLKDKMFYYNKAQNLSSEIFEEKKEQIELSFEHDLNNSEKKIINDVINLINTQSKELFESTMDNYNSSKINLIEINRKINRIDANVVDEFTREQIINKENAEHILEDNLKQIGAIEEKKEKLKKDNIRLNIEYQNLLQKIDITQANKTKFQKTKEYIDVLQTFVDSQKSAKKESLEKNILFELKKLMHKLQDEKLDSKFISDVSVIILPDNGGMKVTLFDSNGEEVKKEKLSSGEKQIYISCLIKAILNESIQSLPIFIDTPLGRLDDEHIKNILLYYYPDLSEQVIILSTNNEITPRRFKDIEHNVSKTYLLENDGKKTDVKSGYFKNNEL